jgi:hypothetical protein
MIMRTAQQRPLVPRQTGIWFRGSLWDVRGRIGELHLGGVRGACRAPSVRCTPGRHAPLVGFPRSARARDRPPRDRPPRDSSASASGGCRITDRASAAWQPLPHRPARISEPHDATEIPNLEPAVATSAGNAGLPTLRNDQQPTRRDIAVQV